EEGITSGSTALHGHIVHELRPLLTDAIDVGGFTNHQALMVDAWLHPTDVIPHDEQNVGLRLLLRRSRRDRRHRGSDQGKRPETELLAHTHLFVSSELRRNLPAHSAPCEQVQNCRARSYELRG